METNYLYSIYRQVVKAKKPIKISIQELSDIVKFNQELVIKMRPYYFETVGMLACKDPRAQLVYANHVNLPTDKQCQLQTTQQAILDLTSIALNNVNLVNIIMESNTANVK